MAVQQHWHIKIVILSVPFSTGNAAKTYQADPRFFFFFSFFPFLYGVAVLGLEQEFFTPWMPFLSGNALHFHGLATVTQLGWFAQTDPQLSTQIKTLTMWRKLNPIRNVSVKFLTTIFIFKGLTFSIFSLKLLNGFSKVWVRCPPNEPHLACLPLGTPYSYHPGNAPLVVRSRVKRYLLPPSLPPQLH